VYYSYETQGQFTGFLLLDAKRSNVVISSFQFNEITARTMDLYSEATRLAFSCSLVGTSCSQIIAYSDFALVAVCIEPTHKNYLITRIFAVFI